MCRYIKNRKDVLDYTQKKNDQLWKLGSLKHCMDSDNGRPRVFDFKFYVPSKSKQIENL
jgi:hypothetical protein